MNLDLRLHALIELSAYTGREVPADFIRLTSDHFPAAGIDRIHHLIEGIYKPAGSPYTFCIWSKSAAGMDEEVYSDELSIDDDGSWTFRYAAKSGDLNSSVNQSLMNCWRDRVPVLVIVTTRASSASKSARYRILGPALIEDFKRQTRLFSLRGCSQILCDEIKSRSTPLDAEILSLRNLLITPFNLHEKRSVYGTYRDVRDQAFRRIILDEYRCQCTVCQSKFLLRQEGKESLVEAEAGHIIPVQFRGPDDPRNGLSFCRRHHWAFDQGLFTVTDGRRIKVSPAVQRAVREKFDLEEYDGETVIPPASEACVPNEEALHWHQKKVFLRN